MILTAADAKNKYNQMSMVLARDTDYMAINLDMLVFEIESSNYDTEHKNKFMNRIKEIITDYITTNIELVSRLGIGTYLRIENENIIQAIRICRLEDFIGEWLSEAGYIIVFNNSFSPDKQEYSIEICW